MHLISRLFATHVNANTQEQLAYCFCLKIPKLEPQLRHHWAMSKHHKRKLNVYSVFLLSGETEAIPCFCHPFSTSQGCSHRIAAEHGGAPRDTEFSPSGLHRSYVLFSRRAMSVLHCLRKKSPGVLQVQSLAQVREAKDTAWNAPWIKQWRMGPQRVNITPTRRSGIHTAAPGTEFFLLPLKMFDGPTTGFIGHHYFCFSNFFVKELVC